MADFTLEDSGARREFVTGSMRDVDTDKPRYDLIPPEGLYRLAMLYTRGAKKYAPRNWEKGQPCSVVLASMMRHVEKYRQGDRTEDHLAAVAWNAFAIMTFEDRVEAGELPPQLLDTGASEQVKAEVVLRNINLQVFLRDNLLEMLREGNWGLTTRELYVISQDRWPKLIGDVSEELFERLVLMGDVFSLDADGRWIAS